MLYMKKYAENYPEKEILKYDWLLNLQTLDPLKSRDLKQEYRTPKETSSEFRV